MDDSHESDYQSYADWYDNGPGSEKAIRESKKSSAEYHKNNPTFILSKDQLDYYKKIEKEHKKLKRKIKINRKQRKNKKNYFKLGTK
jgi:hypothetical protein